MLRNRLLRLLAAPLALIFATSLFARGQFWDFLGCTQVSESQDHGRIQIARRDRLFFRTIQLRVSGKAIFFDRFVVHFDNGTSEVLPVSERISPETGNYVFDLPGGPRALESVELWYYKEPWGQNPQISLYGVPLPDPNGETIAREH